MPRRRLLTLCLPLFLAACGENHVAGTATVEEANAAGILLVGNSQEPKSIDPQIATGVPESKIFAALFEGLVGDHPSSDSTWIAAGATSWEDTDATTWTFHLRPEAQWSDGVPVTAHDYVFAYHRILCPSFGGPYAAMLYFLKNGQEYNEGHLGYLLCGLDPAFPLPWEQLRAADFRGPEGLDHLELDALRAIRAGSRSFPWPDSVPAAAREAVLARLIAHHEAGEPDLWERARVGVEALDDHTLRIVTRGPTPILPGITRHYTWFPVPRHILEPMGEQAFLPPGPGNNWTRELVSNGPFRLRQWRYNHFLEVERNPHHWDRAALAIQGLRFLPVNAAATEERMFRDGLLHTTANGLNAERIEWYRQNRPSALRQEPYVGTQFLRVNVTRKPLDDARVRRALALTVPRDAITSALLPGYQAAWAVTPKLGDFVPPDAGIGFHPDEARRLLAEAGFPGGRGFPRDLSLLIASRGEAPKNIAEILQRSWKEHLGIEIGIENKEWTSYLDAQNKLEFDLCAAGWIGDYLDPLTFQEMWIASSGNNNTGWKNPAFDRLIEQSNQEADPARRLEILTEAERILLTELPVLPMAWYQRNYLLDESVHGWYPLALDNHPWSSVSLGDTPPPPVPPAAPHTSHRSAPAPVTGS